MPTKESIILHIVGFGTAVLRATKVVELRKNIMQINTIRFEILWL